MDIRQTLFLYLLLGAGVAIGFAARSQDRARAWVTILAAWVFWPLFVPLLLGEETAEEAAAPASNSNRDELATRVQQSGELLDRLVASLPPVGISDLQLKLTETKNRWAAQLAWLAEADSLMQMRFALTPEQTRLDELRCMQTTTEASLARSLDSVQELAVVVQILKAPGADPTPELARLERVLTAILELDTPALRTTV